MRSLKKYGRFCGAIFLISNGLLLLRKGSFYEGTLEEGTTVKFLDLNNNGMYSRGLKKHIPNKEKTFLHLGDIFDGVETQQDWGKCYRILSFRRN